jgi:hypothetical protein
MKFFLIIAVLSTEPEYISLDVDSELMQALGVSYIAPISNEEEIVDSEWAWLFENESNPTPALESFPERTHESEPSNLMKDSPDKKKISGKRLRFHGPKIERLAELHRTIVTEVVVANPEKSRRFLLELTRMRFGECSLSPMSDSTMMNFLSRTKVALNISAPYVFKRKSEELLDEIFKADPNISSDTSLIQLTREMSLPPSKDTVEAFLRLKRATLLKSS